MIANASHTAVVILAAGASKRMGTPKQLLGWGENSTLLKHAIETASEVEPGELIVVLGAHFQKIEKEIKGLNITILNNTRWETGLGSSIACASKYLLKSSTKKRNILITLADQPFITSEYLGRMIREFTPDQKEIVASAYQNRPYGVPALFDTCYLEELSDLSDDHGARFLLQSNKSAIKVLKPPRQNPDIDTQEDYEEYHKN